ncbi:MAG: hypothetical protein WAQ53_09265 [Thiofilum sp.]|uniref:hypothetical protein n=1 Tax=Thiofilum sp. TaxID=2212733 RepID=UPI0025D97D1E|nr:hypothetical protein [Thiofilum sp.]MBK8451892.1 hypothetical protein [Thiofilum sp.]
MKRPSLMLLMTLALAFITCEVTNIAAFEKESMPAIQFINDATTPPDINSPPTPSIPNTANGHEITIFNGEYWKVFKQHPSGIITLHYKDKKSNQFIEFSLPRAWRFNWFPMLHLEANKGDLYIIIYDVKENAPSGRTLETIRNGFDVYRITPNKDALPERIAENLQLGGIDTTLYGSLEHDSLHLCGDNKCVSVTKSGVLEWQLASLSSYEWVELVFHKQNAAAIIRKRYDDRSDGLLTNEFSTYSLVLFNNKDIKHLESAPNDGIPWHLKWQENQQHPTYRLATTQKDLIKLFYYDFNRMRYQGLIDFGANNFEGRIAWSQTYYLHGLLSLIEGKLLALVPKDLELLKQRIVSEISLLSQLCKEDYPSFRVKRYSLEREPVLFALHLGRIAHLLVRTQAILGTSDINDCLPKLTIELTQLTHTIEQLSSSYVQNLGNISYLYYRKGMPFWADGVNVPYNYVSGYVEGLLSINNNSIEKAETLLSPLLLNEFLNKTPQLWRYWWGVGDQGWNSRDQISLNTPSYSGNKGAMAHITYRTMDAKALLALENLNSTLVEKELIMHFQKLTQEGWLLPDMNEYWVKKNKTVLPNPIVAKRYPRSTSPWELQSQPWAIQSIILETH